MLKAEFRKYLLKERLNLSSEKVNQLSQLIIEHVLKWDRFHSFQHIGLYQAFKKEVNLNALWIKAHHSGKKTYFPVIHANNAIKTMHFTQASPFDKLSLNHFNIKEPSSELPSIELEKIDCLFIPLVGFDNNGYRLGMGQGYYDRAINPLSKKPYCLGVAYSFQEIKNLPHDPWDLRLDGVVTEKGIKFFTN